MRLGSPYRLGLIRVPPAGRRERGWPGDWERGFGGFRVRVIMFWVWWALVAAHRIVYESVTGRAAPLAQPMDKDLPLYPKKKHMNKVNHSYHSLQNSCRGRKGGDDRFRWRFCRLLSSLVTSLVLKREDGRGITARMYTD